MIREIEVSNQDKVKDVRILYGLGKEWRFVHRFLDMMVFEKPEAKQ